MTEPTEPTRPTAPGPDAQPTLHIIAGNPDPDEIAALVAVLSVCVNRATPGQRPRRSLWAARSRQVRPVLGAGPGSWRASTLPR